MTESTATAVSSYSIDLYGQCARGEMCTTETHAQTNAPEIIGRAAAALLIGITTITPTFTQDIKAPSMGRTFDGVFEFIDESQAGQYIPKGFEIHNENKVSAYIKHHPYLKIFLENNLEKLKDITGTAEFGIDYEGIMEEGWENLFLIIYLEEYDDSYVSELEDRIYHEWFNDVSDIVKSRLTISFDWK